MLLRKTACLIFGVFLLAGGVAQSQTTATSKKELSVIKPDKKTWRVVDGFRSAKFGMTENQVIQAIVKDFKVSKNKVMRIQNSNIQNKNLVIRIPKLMETEGAGPADIAYGLGYKSKRLMQVNIDWGKAVSKNFTRDGLLSIAFHLRNFFSKNKYMKSNYTVDGMEIINGKVSDSSTIVFRGQDKKGRMIFLRYIGSKDNTIEANKNLRLILSYIEKPEKPDIIPSKAK